MANQTESAPIIHMTTQIDHAPTNKKSSNNLVWCSKCQTEYKQGTTHNCSGYGIYYISSLPLYANQYANLW